MRVLVFHRAVGFVHASIPAAVDAIRDLSERHRFAVDATDDPDRFREHILAEYSALVFVHTSGDVLPEVSQRRALETYVRGGGGWFGIHGAACVGEDVAEQWPFYRRLVGARFIGHTAAYLYTDNDVAERPGVVVAGSLADAPDYSEAVGDTARFTSCVPAVVKVEDPSSPAIGGIADGMTIIEEWYGFDETPRPHVHVVAAVDESTYDAAAGAMGDDHPIVWQHAVGDGRAIYNAMGHSLAAWADPTFLETVLGGIEVAAGTPVRPT